MALKNIQMISLSEVGTIEAAIEYLGERKVKSTTAHIDNKSLFWIFLVC